ncbi:MAG: serine protease [bacterium]
MIKVLILIMTVLFSPASFSQGFEGVYQLEIENNSGHVISKASGFLVRSAKQARPYIITSFHLVNAMLLDADKIKVVTDKGVKKYIQILGYDELNDILALSSDGIMDQPLVLSNSCTQDLNVAGYHDGSLLAVNINGSDIMGKGISKLPVYLSKGFSGAPVMNYTAEVCGMVVLSSEQNASSIAVSSQMIEALLDSIQINSRPLSIKTLRLMMGVEKIVSNQSELDLVLSESTNHGQLIINIIPKKPEEKFIIRDASDIVVEGNNSLKSLIVHHSKNIMVRGINTDRLIINESSSITVTNCIFEQKTQALFLKDSRDLLISDNLFKNINTGIVLKSSEVDSVNLLNNNKFEFVQNKVQQI